MIKKLMSLFVFAVLAAGLVSGQGYKVGDKAADFRLKNVDGSLVSMSDYPDAKGFVVVFTCNHCPYAVAYEDRLIELNNTYKAKGFPVIAINPNDPALEPRDSYENMQKRAKEKGFTFPYLVDEGQEVFPEYGATRTPHIFLLKRTGEDLVVSYIGAIDDNHQDPDAVEERFLANAINAVMEGRSPEPDYTRAIGCGIKSAN
jgi:peroxiredoxin